MATRKKVASKTAKKLSKKKAPKKKGAKRTQTRPSVKKRKRLTLRDRLSQLTYLQACKLLGKNGAELIRKPIMLSRLDPRKDIYLGGDLFRFTIHDFDESGKPKKTIVSITTLPKARSQLHFHCSECSRDIESSVACPHVGTVLSFILEEKTLLGLAESPDMETPLELLSEKQLIRRALHEREERAKGGLFRVKCIDANGSEQPASARKGRASAKKSPWADYAITNRETGKTYRVALRGTERGQSFCSCPDFRVNRLGTCKHIMFMLNWIKRQFSAKLRNTPHRNDSTFVHVFYGEALTLHLVLSDAVLEKASKRGRKNQQEKQAAQIVKAANPVLDKPIENMRQLMRVVAKIERLGESVTIYPDAEELIERRLFEERMKEQTETIRQNPSEHPLRTQLLKEPLLPYQLDGIAFATGIGRAVLADDMGLGKTIQGIGVAELLTRTVDIRKVLIICPASVKSQWRNEIYRFSRRDVQIVIGSAQERFRQYNNDAFFTICNYEQVLRDHQPIEQTNWDLIILDEGQRIKNWESQTAKRVKSLKSTFALVLSGTPLENRIDELYSVLQFIDDRRLPPAYRFFHQHRIVDDRGKVKGYKQLDKLRERLRPVLLRRTRESVLLDLPERTTEIVRVSLTTQQADIHNSSMQTAAQIANKKFLTEIDFRRLQMALATARMACDSTYLVNKETPAYSGKLERFKQVIQDLFAEPDRKAVLFSEWTTMLNLIEPILKKKGLRFVRLDGSVPQKKRQSLVAQFRDDPNCRLFITTNAGSVGLNLQSANTVINMDLPWNPAVLEQRVGRAHRMGQKQNVQVYLFVTENSIEENMLATLSVKHDLAMAALDSMSDVSTLKFESGIEEMKRRLEVLLGAKPPAPTDQLQQTQTLRDTGTALPEPSPQAPDLPLGLSPSIVSPQPDSPSTKNERIADAGGELVTSLLKFAGELLGEEAANKAASAISTRLNACVEERENGAPYLSIPLPDQQTLQNLTQSFAQLFAPKK